MTRNKKIGISFALMLILVLVSVAFVPLFKVNNSNIASAAAPVITDTASTWDNPYNGDYYKLNEDLVGTEFRTQLAKLIGPSSRGGTHHTLTTYRGSNYNSLPVVLQQSDADPDKPGNIIWFYTGTSVKFDGSFGSAVGSTNREHVWAKNSGDTFPAEEGPGADAHHLRPTEMQMNGYRSNFGFGEVAQTNANAVKEAGNLNYGSTADALCYLASYGGSKLFYPAKGYRGATARILFYMQVRWGDDNNLNFVDGITTNDGKSIGKISDLMKWHLEEPPTDQEIRRNNVVAGIQGNRNPFIDHPEYAEMIYCHDGQSYNNKLQQVVDQYGSYLENDNEKAAPTKLTLSASTLNLTIGAQSSKITVTPTPSDASNKVTWSTSNSSVATVSTTGIITAVSEGTATITATSTRDNNVSASLTVTVTRPALQKLTISPSSLSLTSGGTRQLTVTASPTGADGSVSWSSSDSNVVTVSSTGFVTAVSEGTATITATSTVNSSIKATLTVNVISQAQNSQLFADRVNAISKAKSLKDRFDAINEAINAYNQMISAEKSANAATYATLQQAIAAYNQDIAAANKEFAEANNLASQILVSSVSLSFLALAIVAVKRLLAR